MAESSNEKLFRTKVLPIMDKVMADLRHKQLEEIGRHTSSLSFIMAGAAGPDGGMSAQAASLDALRYTGKWNSKHTEDYINMVKAELKKQHITVTPEIEKMMIDKMIKDEVPKSSIEYIMRKAATNTIFYLPQAMSKSPLENHITEQAEKRYNPSALEKGTGYALGATADFLSMGGFGGGWGGFGGGWSSAAKFVGVDVGLNAALEHFGGSTEYTSTGTKVTPEGKKKPDVPLIIAPEYREQYLTEQAKKKTEQVQPTEQKPKANQKVDEDVRPAPSAEITTETPAPQSTQATEQELPQQTNQSGWTGLLTPQSTQATEQELPQQTNQSGWTGLLKWYVRYWPQPRLCPCYASRHDLGSIHGKDKVPGTERQSDASCQYCGWNVCQESNPEDGACRHGRSQSPE